MTLELRPITGPDELDLFLAFPYVLNDEVAKDLDAGRRHPHWLWVALDDGRPVARAGFWSRPGDAEPELFDIFDLREGEAGRQLVEAALTALGRQPDFLRYVSPGWRDDPAERRGVELRLGALERLGARLLVERLRMQWEAGTPVPEPTGRLAFRQPAGADELIGLMARVLDGTLDAHSRDELTRMTPAESARAQHDDELAGYASPREWWRVATLPGGAPAGFVIPAHNGYNPIIAYIGVVPEHRGHGYAGEILAEGTRILRDQGVPRIRASTDVGNTPMAAAFARAGYPVVSRQLDMVWR